MKQAALGLDLTSRKTRNGNDARLTHLVCVTEWSWRRGVTEHAAGRLASGAGARAQRCIRLMLTEGQIACFAFRKTLHISMAPWYINRA